MNIAKKTRRLSEGRFTTLGALVHNPRDIADLPSRGVESEEDISYINGGIVGGKTNSNSHTLYRISKRILPQTFIIEKAGQITPQMLRGANKIGISGGASTPPEDIQEAVVKIQKSSKQSTRREKSVQCPR